MNDRTNFGEAVGDTANHAAVPRPENNPHAGPQSPKCLPEQARLKELEAANARLLSLVGELLVVNQQLRERIAS